MDSTDISYIIWTYHGSWGHWLNDRQIKSRRGNLCARKGLDWWTEPAARYCAANHPKPITPEPFSLGWIDASPPASISQPSQIHKEIFTSPEDEHSPQWLRVLNSLRIDQLNQRACLVERQIRAWRLSLAMGAFTIIPATLGDLLIISEASITKKRFGDLESTWFHGDLEHSQDIWSFSMCRTISRVLDHHAHSTEFWTTDCLHHRFIKNQLAWGSACSLRGFQSISGFRAKCCCGTPGLTSIISYVNIDWWAKLAFVFAGLLFMSLPSHSPPLNTGYSMSGLVFSSA